MKSCDITKKKQSDRNAYLHLGILVLAMMVACFFAGYFVAEEQSVEVNQAKIAAEQSSCKCCMKSEDKPDGE